MMKEIVSYMLSEKIKRTIRNYSYESFWVAFDQIGTAIASLLSIKIITSLLDPYEFGYIALANTIIFLLSSSIYGPIGQSFMRFWSIAKERQELKSFYRLLNRSLNITLVISFLAGAIISGSLFILCNLKWAVLITISILLAVCSGWTSVRTSILTAARKRKTVSLIHVAGIFLRPLIAAILIMKLGNNANIAMLGFLLAAVSIFLFTEKIFQQFVSSDLFLESQSESTIGIPSNLLKNILSMAGSFFMWSMFSWIKSSADRWALQSFYGPETVGIFNVVLQLANYTIIMMSGFLTTLFNPIAFQRAKGMDNPASVENARKLMTRMFFIYGLGAVMLVVIFAFLHHPLVLIISNEKYAGFSFFLPELTFGLALYQLGEMLGSAGVLFNRLQVFLIPKIATSLITALAMVLFSKWFGPSGVVWATILAGMLYVPWCIIVTVRLSTNVLDQVTSNGDNENKIGIYT